MPRTIDGSTVSFFTKNTALTETIKNKAEKLATKPKINSVVKSPTKQNLVTANEVKTTKTRLYWDIFRIKTRKDLKDTLFWAK